MHARSLLHVRAQRERIGPQFGWGELEALLARDARNSADYRFFKSGKKISPALLGLVDKHGALQPQMLQRLIQQGITIVGNRLEYKLPAFWPLMCELQRCTGGDVTLGFVASFDCPRALPIHYDYVDNIVVQTEGSKRWRLYGDPIAGSGWQRELERTPEGPIKDIQLSRGDLLFVPSGLHHVCIAEQDSLHLGMLVSWPTGVQVLEHVINLAKGDEAVCEPLRRFSDEASLLSSERRIKERLHALIDSVDARGLLEVLANKAARDARLLLPRRAGDEQ